MYIQSVGQKNNPNFGIKFINKSSCPKVLAEAIEKSGVVRAIDSKYPDAYVKYSKAEVSGFDLANGEPDFMASLFFGLGDKKVSSFHMNSHSSDGADSALKRLVSSLSLETVEKQAKEDVQYPTRSLNVTYKVEKNPVKNLWNRVTNFFLKQ